MCVNSSPFLLAVAGQHRAVFLMKRGGDQVKLCRFMQIMQTEIEVFLNDTFSGKLKYRNENEEEKLIIFGILLEMRKITHVLSPQMPSQKKTYHLTRRCVPGLSEHWKMSCPLPKLPVTEILPSSLLSFGNGHVLIRPADCKKQSPWIGMDIYHFRQIVQEGLCPLFPTPCRSIESLEHKL